MKHKTVEDLANSISPQTNLKLNNGTILTVISCYSIKENYDFLATSSFNGKESKYNLMNLWARGQLSDYIEGHLETKPVSNTLKISYNNCSRLFSLLDKSERLNYSKHLWHYAHVDNLISIIKDGMLIARHFNDHIKVDSYKEIPESKEVMDSNKSSILNKYVRLNLRPFTAAYNDTIKYPKYCGGNVVYVSFNRELIFKSDTKTFLIARNAHCIYDTTLSENVRLNKKINSEGEDNAIKYLKDHINHVYSSYQFGEPEWLKDYRHAECLVYKMLPIQFIDKIYFMPVRKCRNPNYDYFINAIKNHPNYNIIKDKIVCDYIK